MVCWMHWGFFITYLDILKNHYCEMRHVDTTQNVNPIWNLLNKWELDAQQSLFKWP